VSFHAETPPDAKDVLALERILLCCGHLDPNVDRAGGRGMASVRPQSPSRASSRSFCTASGSTEPSSTGRRRRLQRNEQTISQGFRRTAGKDVPAGTMAVVRSPVFLRALNQRDCACNIDPPASSYAIMRRAGPYRGENSVGPTRMIAESLTPKPGIREHNLPLAYISIVTLTRLSSLTHEADILGGTT
jgi:hypothetical protein